MMIPAQDNLTDEIYNFVDTWNKTLEVEIDEKRRALVHTLDSLIARGEQGDRVDKYELFAMSTAITQHNEDVKVTTGYLLGDELIHANRHMAVTWTQIHVNIREELIVLAEKDNLVSKYVMNMLDRVSADIENSSLRTKHFLDSNRIASLQAIPADQNLTSQQTSQLQSNATQYVPTNNINTDRVSVLNPISLQTETSNKNIGAPQANVQLSDDPAVETTNIKVSNIRDTLASFNQLAATFTRTVFRAKTKTQVLAVADNIQVMENMLNNLPHELQSKANERVMSCRNLFGQKVREFNKPTPEAMKYSDDPEYLPIPEKILDIVDNTQARPYDDIMDEIYSSTASQSSTNPNSVLSSIAQSTNNAEPSVEEMVAQAAKDRKYKAARKIIAPPKLQGEISRNKRFGVAETIKEIENNDEYDINIPKPSIDVFTDQAANDDINPANSDDDAATTNERPQLGKLSRKKTSRLGKIKGEKKGHGVSRRNVREENYHLRHFHTTMEKLHKHHRKEIAGIVADRRKFLMTPYYGGLRDLVHVLKKHKHTVKKEEGEGRKLTCSLCNTSNDHPFHLTKGGEVLHKKCFEGRGMTKKRKLIEDEYGEDISPNGSKRVKEMYNEHERAKTRESIRQMQFNNSNQDLQKTTPQKILGVASTASKKYIAHGEFDEKTIHLLAYLLANYINEGHASTWEKINISVLKAKILLHYKPKPVHEYYTLDSSDHNNLTKQIKSNPGILYDFEEL